MKAWIKRLLPAVVLGMAVWSPAPIIDQVHGAPTRTETQQDVEQQQRFNGTVDVRGHVVEDTTPNEVSKATSNPTGRDVFNAAQDQESLENARKTMKEAQRTVEQKSHPMWLWAVLIGALGFGSVMGLRAWANKAIPEPPKPQKVRW